MSDPRRIVPGNFWLITRRCVQRMFLMRPDDKMNNAYLYCLIEAAQMFNIRLMLSMMMSNHHHTVVYDPYGMVVEFYHRFHTNLAKCVNVLRGRDDNMWSSAPPSLVELVDPNAIIDKLVYTATNPVKDGLVEKVHHWPGPKLTSALLEGRVLRARRPTFLFRDDGPMPAEVEITLTIPAELGDHDEVVAKLREGITKIEDTCARERAESGRQVVGRRRILRQSWRDSPKTFEARREIRPRVAARDKWARIAAVQINREFRLAYRSARALWLEGKQAIFPRGTYWLRRFANVIVAAVDPPPIPITN